MEILYAIVGLVVGLQLTVLWVWSQQGLAYKARIRELAQVQKEFAETTRKAAEVSQSWAVAVADVDRRFDLMQDQVSAIKMSLQGQKR